MRAAVQYSTCSTTTSTLYFFFLVYFKVLLKVLVSSKYGYSCTREFPYRSIAVPGSSDLTLESLLHDSSDHVISRDFKQEQTPHSIDLWSAR